MNQQQNGQGGPRQDANGGPLHSPYGPPPGSPYTQGPAGANGAGQNHPAQDSGTPVQQAGAGQPEQHNAQQNANGPGQPGGNKNPRDLGQQIGDTVRSVLYSGDLGRLADIGPMVQNALRDMPGVNASMSTRTETRVARTHGRHMARTGGGTAWMGAAQKPRVPGQYAGVVSMVFGSIGMAAFGPLTLLLALPAAFGAFTSDLLFTGWTLAAMFGGLFLASAALFRSGLTKRSLRKKVKAYYALLSQKAVRSYEELAEATNTSVAQVRKTVQRAMRKNLMPDVHTDAQDTCLIYGREAYDLYVATERARQDHEAEEAARRRLEENDPKAAELAAFKREGAMMLEGIRRANDAIPGEEISQKLERLEATTARIFAYVERHPEKLADIRRLMNYYLPTTLKLVERYQQYDEMEVQPENVKRAKTEIEKAMDDFDVAFNNLLESLYHDDTLDVSTDIEVMHNMMAQEGLTGRRFRVTGKESVQEVALLPTEEAPTARQLAPAEDEGNEDTTPTP